MKFDYVIAGGGTCGLLLANRLSADPTVTVVVIEPGQDVRNNPNVTNPDNFLSGVLANTSIDWAYLTEPQRGAANRTLVLHSGKALGGTSTINGMTYIRADAAEIDAWEALGNEGWNWDALLPYYKRTENYTRPTEAQVAVGASYEAKYHGEDGLLRVGNLEDLPGALFHDLVQESWQNLGYLVNPDVNSGDTRGFDVFPMTVDRDESLRWDAARAFYYPVENRTNLKVLHGTAAKLTWASQHEGEGKTANGVDVLDLYNDSISLEVGKEVILSAGALRTPPILEASGVGNPNILSNLGIETIIDLPGVGENLQEQPNTALIFTGNLNVTGYPPYATFATADDIFGTERSAFAEATKSNLTEYAQAIASASNVGLNVSAIKQVLQIQHDLMFTKNVTIGETVTLAIGEDFVTSHWLLMPFSRGSVHLRASYQKNTPAIDPGYFLIDFDMTQQIGIGQQAQKFWHSSPMSQYITGNVTGIPASKEEWVDFIKNSCARKLVDLCVMCITIELTMVLVAPNYHPIGTAAMMSRQLGGVVNKEMKVYGTNNVRVVDASVLPLQTSGHPTSTLYAVAERAADLILASCCSGGH